MALIRPDSPPGRGAAATRPHRPDRSQTARSRACSPHPRPQSERPAICRASVLSHWRSPRSGLRASAPEMSLSSSCTPDPQRSHHYITACAPVFAAERFFSTQFGGRPLPLRRARPRRQILGQEPLQQVKQVLRGAGTFVDTVRPVAIGHHGEGFVGGNKGVDQRSVP